MKIDDIRNVKALVFGDYMIDKYIGGNVKRISPEAPVPVIDVNFNEIKLGGAGNVVNYIVDLGGSVRVVGCVGEDENGTWIINNLNEKKVDTSFMKRINSIKTICKTRVVSKNQQFLRYDEESNATVPGDYEEYIKKNIDDILNGIDIVIISDYNKGTVTESISQFIISNANRFNIPIIVDPKGDNYYKYKGATICTPNTNELQIICNNNLANEEDVSIGGINLCQKYDLKYLMLTRSEKGISLFKQGNDEKIDFPAVPKEVIDVTGAGDTVVAIVALLYAAAFSIDECCKIANIAASIVISKFGASTVTLNELMCYFSNNAQYKLIDKELVSYIINDLKDKNKSIVFTNGCFDLFHVGHLSSLKRAKALGNVLIVAVNSDASVKRIKGNSRPIINEKNRVELLCSLECVDYVMIMDEDTPVELINLIQPNISVKGIDWKNKYVPEKELIEQLGGRIEFIELEKGISTTSIIDKILEEYHGDN